MRKINISILSAVMMLLMIFSSSVFAAGGENQTTGTTVSGDSIGSSATNAVGVSYRTHVQDLGWEYSWAKDEDTSGTTGRSFRLEGIQMKLTGDLPEGAKIEYRTHVQDIGWETNWSTSSQTAGTEGRCLRLEGIQIRLVNMPGYSVEYKTHVENLGWEKNWSADGDVSGTYARSLRLEGIKIRIVKEGSDLTEYDKILDTIKNTEESEFTTYSWQNLVTILKENIVTIKNSQDEVDVATATIQEAFDKLESETDAMIFSKAGIYGLSSGTTVINQDVIVDADGVILQNLQIKGNLIISEAVEDGEVTLNNVTVEGKTYIRGGGENSILINGGVYNTVTVQNVYGNRARIVATNLSGLAVVLAEGISGDTVILEGVFANVLVDAPNMKLTTQGTTVIGKMTTTPKSAGSTVTLETNTRVDKMVFNGKTDVKGNGRIVAADVNADSVTYEKEPEQQTIASTVKILPRIPAAIAITSITVSSETGVSTVAKGSKLQMSVAILPANATNQKIKWAVTSGTGTATITDTGLLTAISNGTVSVKATALDGSGKYGEKTLTIDTQSAPTISTLKTITNGESNPPIIVTLSNDTFTPTANLTSNWILTAGTTGLSISSVSRDSATQVTINTTGVAKDGTLKIQAKEGALSRDVVSTELSLVVPKVLATDIAVTGTGNANTIITDDGTLQMVSTATPTNTTNQEVTWNITIGSEYASISSSGLLTAYKNGTVTVRATAQDGTLKYGEMQVTISNQKESTIATVSSLTYDATVNAVVLTLTNDKFTSTVDSATYWSCISGTTGLTIDSITRTSDTQVTIKLAGTTKNGILKLQAKAGALTSGAVSNLLEIPVSGISITGVSISGSPTVGSTLTATSLLPSGATATYKWYRADSVGGPYADIAATGSSYLLTSADSGKFFKVEATGSGSYIGTVLSAPSTVVINVVPTAKVTGLTFTDTDTDSNQMGGTLSWSAPVDVSNVTHYVIYASTDGTTKGAQIGADVAVGTNQMTIPANTALSPKIIVVTKNAVGEAIITNYASITITDVVPVVPTAKVTGLTFLDTDTNASEMGGTLSWSPPSDVSNVTHYVIYASTDGTTKGAQIGADVAVGTNQMTISDNTALAPQIIVVTKNAVGEAIAVNYVSIVITDVTS